MHEFPDSSLLYHYTTLNGLRGILASRSLWFSHISSFNDPSELQYGKSVVIDQLNDAIMKEDDQVVKKLLSLLIGWIKAFDNALLYHTYVACFCEKDNLLSQWRGYAASGGGYSIGISFDSGTKFSYYSENLSEESHLILRKVIYELADQKEVVTKCLERIIEGGKNADKRIAINQNTLSDTWIEQAAMESCNILFDILLSLKNPAFAEEKEWRLVKIMAAHNKPELLKFRETSESLIPYIHTYIYEKINDGTFKFPIRTLRYGPMLEDVKTKAAMELLICNNSKATDPIRIDPTKIRVLGAGFNLRF